MPHERPLTGAPERNDQGVDSSADMFDHCAADDAAQDGSGVAAAHNGQAAADDGQALSAAAVVRSKLKLDECFKEVFEMVAERNYCATVPSQFSREFQTGYLAAMGDLTRLLASTARDAIDDPEGAFAALEGDADAVTAGRRPSNSSKCHAGVHTKGGRSRK